MNYVTSDFSKLVVEGTAANIINGNLTDATTVILSYSAPADGICFTLLVIDALVDNHGMTERAASDRVFQLIQRTIR